jgi:hypothetical protein
MPQERLSGKSSMATVLLANLQPLYAQALQDIEDILAALCEHNLAIESVTPAQDMAPQHL